MCVQVVFRLTQQTLHAAFAAWVEWKRHNTQKAAAARLAVGKLRQTAFTKVTTVPRSSVDQCNQELGSCCLQTRCCLLFPLASGSIAGLSKAPAVKQNSPVHGTEYCPDSGYLCSCRLRRSSSSSNAIVSLLQAASDRLCAHVCLV